MQNNPSAEAIGGWVPHKSERKRAPLEWSKRSRLAPSTYKKAISIQKRARWTCSLPTNRTTILACTYYVWSISEGGPAFRQPHLVVVGYRQNSSVSSPLLAALPAKIGKKVSFPSISLLPSQTLTLIPKTLNLISPNPSLFSPPPLSITSAFH